MTTLNELLDMGFVIIEVTNNVQETREITADDYLEGETAEDTMRNYSYESKLLDTDYGLGITSYDLYYKGDPVLRETSNIYLTYFIENEKYLEYMK